ncbi:hypothetical protein EMIHUDRAFT_98688 [Emiliania huxleyi CCMP1516]|uniref:Uncharacterized protein n=2 Tax=Emiliania huxleyi TaxID=2903 RepID=A0A0D3KEV9_EMIH1|nr:hypothetical protein EMIHUDRAFT_98688 [Emiliania huxleyi CCMP1516]EOD34294.1 hypothetical protein EMIHUDRAFT_98688 [Emiliania huxleyi CCMP1516]|eukprot:XP_005786723.1 hypothetical protein EMIHUDRAFT_98688 [Emiliania huxleyi CCMP1516]
MPQHAPSPAQQPDVLEPLTLSALDTLGLWMSSAVEDSDGDNSRFSYGSDEETVVSTSSGSGKRPRRPSGSKHPWTPEEDQIIETSAHKYCSRIAEQLPGDERSDDSVRNLHRLQRKAQRRAGVTRGLAVGRSASVPLQRAGSAPVNAGEQRRYSAGSQVSCSSTSISVEEVAAPALADEGRHGSWTPEEDALIDRAVRIGGLRWKAVAAMLPGRTESGCRNRWVRSQQRNLSQLGIEAKGATEVIAHLRNVGAMKVRKRPSTKPPPPTKPPPEVELRHDLRPMRFPMPLAPAQSEAGLRPPPREQGRAACVPNALPVAYTSPPTRRWVANSSASFFSGNGKQAGRQSPPSIAMHPSHTWFVEEAAPAGGVTWMMMFCDMDTSFGTAGEEGRDFLYTMAGVIDNRHPSRPHAKLVCRFDLRASHLAMACLLLLALSIFVCLYPPRAFVRASDLRPLLERSRHDDLSMA